MKVEWRLLGGLGAFVAPFAALYWFTSYEEAGSVMLVAFVLSLLFLGGYVLMQARRTAPRPEDRTDGAPAPEDEDIGYFPTASMWPLVIGVAATLIGFGLVFTGWLALPGLLLMLGAAVGYARDAQQAE